MKLCWGHQNIAVCSLSLMMLPEPSLSLLTGHLLVCPSGLAPHYPLICPWSIHLTSQKPIMCRSLVSLRLSSLQALLKLTLTLNQTTDSFLIHTLRFSNFLIFFSTSFLGSVFPFTWAWTLTWPSMTLHSLLNMLLFVPGWHVFQNVPMSLASYTSILTRCGQTLTPTPM